MTKLERLIRETENQEESTFDIISLITSTKQQYEDFNEQAWKKGQGYVMPEGNFPIFNKAMEGLESGMFLFAGEPNCGKSATLLEIILQYASNPVNKLFGVYFSLDDTADKLIPRLLASHSQLAGEPDNMGAPISLFSKPGRYYKALTEADLASDQARIFYSYLYEDISAEGTINRDNLDINPDDITLFPNSVRNKAYSWLHSTSDYFKIIDGTIIRSGEQLIDCCKQLQQYIREVNCDPDYNLIIGIDSFSDIIWDNQKFSNDKELNDFTSSRLKAFAVEELKCPLFGTIHLRKIDQKKRPTIADVKESGRWAYEASVVFIIHNDVSRSGEAAKIYGVTDDSDFKLPVIEILWAKNKQSAFKGRTYCYFKTDYSRVWECGEDAHKRFNSLIYSL